ncbi:hypothetical protein K2Q08_02035 [Patescibacteria group bacterium]|nr:hypothetical protein [Patescibacteria group bacterium]
MAKEKYSAAKHTLILLAVGCALVFGLVYLAGYSNFVSLQYAGVADAEGISDEKPTKPIVFDKQAYDKKLLYLAHVAESSPWYEYFLTGTTTGTTTVKKELWPVKAAYPNQGALLPYNRIVAYYGNFYSKGMGVLGEYPEEQMLAMLRATVADWEAADPQTPVVPAINYIVITAQGSAGKDGKYRLRMPDSQVDRALELAAKVNGVVILDMQVGLSNVQTEVPQYEKYLSMPNVHLGLDPEFDMPGNVPPGDVIGSMSATDINWAADYLANLVKQNNLPPKFIVIHRFTEGMVKNYELIKPLPEVQFIMDMDGWGFGAKKINTYNSVIAPEPVQFTGFKLFYKNDLKPPSKAMMTPDEVLRLTPAPSFIQYQ